MDSILDAIEGKTGKRPERINMISTLARKAKVGDIFFRVHDEANTFGLREWRTPAAIQ